MSRKKRITREEELYCRVKTLTNIYVNAMKFKDYVLALEAINTKIKVLEEIERLLIERYNKPPTK